MFENLPKEAFPIMKKMHLNIKKSQELTKEFVVLAMELSQFYGVEITPDLLKAIENGVTK